MTGDKTILVVGATGTLGGLITRELVACEGVRVRALIRPGSRDRAEASLGEAVDLVDGDLSSDRASLVEACEGADAVVSAVQGGPDVIIDGQLALLAAASAAGVRRFIPSDYSYDIFGLDPGDNINTDWRRMFAERAAGVRGGVQVAHVLNGAFLDVQVVFGFLGAFDLERGTMALWGDGKAPMDFTTYADTARYTALAATREEVPDEIQVAGDTLDFWQLEAAFEAGTGRALEVVHHGSLAELDAEIAGRREAQPDNPYAWLPLMYWRGMLSGKGKLRRLVNDLFPEVTPTTVEAYVSAHREQLAGAGLPTDIRS